MIIQILIFYFLFKKFLFCPNEKYCASCITTESFYCSKCFYAYYNSRTGLCKQPRVVIDNCLEYAFNKKTLTKYCYRCNYGYFTHGSECVSCPSQCSICDINGC